jgi:hypothetical protein
MYGMQVKAQCCIMKGESVQHTGSGLCLQAAHLQRLLEVLLKDGGVPQALDNPHQHLHPSEVWSPCLGMSTREAPASQARWRS